MITFESSGDFKNLEKFLNTIVRGDIYRALEQFGQAGVDALASATPVESGLTAQSWSYEIEKSRSSVRITWLNTNLQNGLPIAILLQYGHGTGTGGYVAGRDYINPAIRPIFDQIADGVWKVVKSA